MREQQFYEHLGKLLKKALDAHPDRDVLCQTALIELTMSPDFHEHLEDFVQSLDLETILEEYRKI